MARSRMRVLLFAIISAWLMMMPAWLLAQGSGYTVTQITTTSTDHRWPALDNDGSAVWCEYDGAHWQVVKAGSISASQINPSTSNVTSDAYDHKYPAYKGGNLLYAKHPVGGGIQWVIIKDPTATIQFSSRDGLSGAHRDAGRFSAVASDGTTVTWYDWYPFAGFYEGRRLEISGSPRYDFFAGYDHPDINKNKDLIFSDGSNIYKATASDPGTVTMPGVGAIARINDRGDIVAAVGTPNSEGLLDRGNIVVYKAPGYASGITIHTGTWASINNDGDILFEGVDASGKHQIFLAKIVKPQVTLTKATTLDAKSVTVDYTISQADISQPLRFDVYRSNTPDMYSASDKVGDQTIDPTTDAADLMQGTHSIDLLSETPLPPNPDKPFVVVVANGDSAVDEDPASVNTTYFQKYLLGGVVHGYSFSNAETFSWMDRMKQDLLKIAKFDDVYTHDWTLDSTRAKSGLATKAGDDMYSALFHHASLLLQRVSHPGDVVDVHLFGHSRGTVVVSQVAADMVLKLDPIWLGSYVEVTLLDIHPANKAADSLLSHSIGLLGWSLYGIVHHFQGIANDPEVNLPGPPARKVAGIMSVDIWSQQTPHSRFPLLSSGDVMNLWGENINDNHVVSGISPLWHDLSGMTYLDHGINVVIGHTEVHEYYRLFLIDQGLIH